MHRSDNAAPIKARRTELNTENNARCFHIIEPSWIDDVDPTITMWSFFLFISAGNLL